MKLLACIVGVLLLMALFLLYCRNNVPTPLRGDPQGMNHPMSYSVPDPRPVMQFDPRKPYRLEFGRGSGWDGLNTIALDDTKCVVLHCMKMEDKEFALYPYCEKATIFIDSETYQQIAQLIYNLRITEMDCEYHANVCDGTQWVFRLIQGGQEKSVYFNNHFPSAIQDFAVAIDEELKNVGSGEIEWFRVPDNNIRDHEKVLWDSIRNKPNKPAISDDNTLPVSVGIE